MTTTYALGGTIGSPDTIGIVPITTTNLVSLVNTATAAMVTATSDMVTVVSDINTVTSNAATVVSDINTVTSDAATVVTDMITTFSSTSTNGLIAAINADNTLSLVYNTTTLQVSGSAFVTNFLVDTANGNTFITRLNALGTAVLALQAAATTAKVDAATLQTNATTAKTDAAAAQTAVLAGQTAVNAIVPNAGSYDVIIQFTKTNVTTAALFNGILNAFLQFARNAGILS